MFLGLLRSGRTSVLLQRPTLDIFQEVLFCILAAGRHLVLKVVPVKAE